MTNERRLAIYVRQRGITKMPVRLSQLTSAQRRRLTKKTPYWERMGRS